MVRCGAQEPVCQPAGAGRGGGRAERARAGSAVAGPVRAAPAAARLLARLAAAVSTPHRPASPLASSSPLSALDELRLVISLAPYSLLHLHLFYLIGCSAMLNSHNNIIRTISFLLH